MLVRLVYFSMATRDMALSDLKEILNVARENNARNNICGMLCYDNSYFLQVLEGERSAVSELYLTIADDPRHDEPTLCHFEQIDQPQFKEWKMGYAGSSPLLAKFLDEHNQVEFNPELLTAKEALELLLSLSLNQQDI